MSDNAIVDEHDDEILSCRCFTSPGFFNAQDARAVALDLLRTPHTEATHMRNLILQPVFFEFLLTHGVEHDQAIELVQALSRELPAMLESEEFGRDRLTAIFAAGSQHGLSEWLLSNQRAF